MNKISWGGWGGGRNARQLGFWERKSERRGAIDEVADRNNWWKMELRKIKKEMARYMYNIKDGTALDGGAGEVHTKLDKKEVYCTPVI